jgi:hypothetical protein
MYTIKIVKACQLEDYLNNLSGAELVEASPQEYLYCPAQDGSTPCSVTAYTVITRQRP